MNAASQRAELYMSTERYSDAIVELSNALTTDPEDPSLHSLMAICLLNMERPKEALQAAAKAVALDPDGPYEHYIMAMAQGSLKQWKLANSSIRRALALDPDFPGAWALLSQLMSQQGKWQESLRAADSGLAIDPDHVDCHNLRARALSFLGRPDLAKLSSHRAIQEDPESAYSHAELGWVELRSGRHKQAMGHFGAALRLDPDDEYARVGLLDALRVRFPLYRWLYQFDVFVARFPPRVQFAIFAGAYVLVRILDSVSDSQPALRPFIVPIVIVYALFAWTSWIGRPLLNITLLLHPLGKLALPRHERVETRVIAAFLAVALAAGIGELAGYGSANYCFVGAVSVVLLSLATRIESSRPLRTGLFWGLATLGALLLAVVLIANVT